MSNHIQKLNVDIFFHRDYTFDLSH